MTSKKSPSTLPPPSRLAHTRTTLTNEVELERARVLSIDEGGDDLLSLANHHSKGPVAQAPLAVSTLPPTTPSQGPLVARPSRPIQGALEVMRSRVQLDDFTGALELARAILKRDTSNTEAKDVVLICEARLERMYRARIGPLERAPRVLVSGEQLKWLSLDHRAGFLLSMIDGLVTFENLLDLSGMPRMDALQLLADLIENDIIDAPVG